MAESEISQSGSSSKPSRKKQLTLSQLQDYLTKQQATSNETNTAFEEHVLGWAQPACLAKGNPKQQ